MVLLSLSIPGINFRWFHLASLLETYGTDIERNCLDEGISFDTHLQIQNNLNVQHSRESRGYELTVEMHKGPIRSWTVLNPFTCSGVISLEPRTSVNLQDDMAEITNEEFEKLAIIHLRMLLTIIKQTDTDRFKRLMDNLSQL